MRKLVLFLGLMSIIGASFAGFDIAGGFSEIPQENLSDSLSDLHTVFSHLSTQYPEFDYILKRIVSGQTQVVQGRNASYRIEAAPKDHADQTIPCSATVYKNLQHEVEISRVKCENNDKTFVYEKE